MDQGLYAPKVGEDAVTREGLRVRNIVHDPSGNGQFLGDFGHGLLCKTKLINADGSSLAWNEDDIVGPWRQPGDTWAPVEGTIAKTWDGRETRRLAKIVTGDRVQFSDGMHSWDANGRWSHDGKPTGMDLRFQIAEPKEQEVFEVKPGAVFKGEPMRIVDNVGSIAPSRMVPRGYTDRSDEDGHRETKLEVDTQIAASAKRDSAERARDATASHHEAIGADELRASWAKTDKIIDSGRGLTAAQVAEISAAAKGALCSAYTEAQIEAMGLPDDLPSLMARMYAAVAGRGSLQRALAKENNETSTTIQILAEARTALRKIARDMARERGITDFRPAASIEGVIEQVRQLFTYTAADLKDAGHVLAEARNKDATAMADQVKAFERERGDLHAEIRRVQDQQAETAKKLAASEMERAGLTEQLADLRQHPCVQEAPMQPGEHRAGSLREREGMTAEQMIRLEVMREHMRQDIFWKNANDAALWVVTGRVDLAP